MIICQTISGPSISISFRSPHENIRRHKNRCLLSRIRSEFVDSSSKSSIIPTKTPPVSTIGEKLLESEGKAKGPYPGGTGVGPYTGRDPNLKKPEWLRQKAPQGDRFQDVKDSLSGLNLHTVCEEAQCPNIGEEILCKQI